jgi:hypothetical protein
MDDDESLYGDDTSEDPESDSGARLIALRWMEY